MQQVDYNKNKLREIIEADRKAYSAYIFPNWKRYIMCLLKREPVMWIYKWQIISRRCDYYHKNPSFLNNILYIFYVRRRNVLGKKLGLEIMSENIGKGMLIYHFNNVINGGSIIGENLHLHGSNVIGNAGPQDLRCPIIGNNVSLGAGAKVIGGVRIEDNIKIGAGAVVVHSFLEPGITIGGVPAKRIK